MAFLAAAPSPFHAVAEARRRLEAHGFTPLDPAESWSDAAARSFVARDGSLVAWAAPAERPPQTPFRLIGAHTDSPNLKVKPKPDTGRAGWRQLGVEVYGGALVNSWLDRDLGLSGRVMVHGAAGPEARLVLFDRALLRVPQLAIHLDREVSSKGLLLNPQQHLTPVWGVGHRDEGGFRRFLAEELDCAATDVLSWDVMTHDVTAPSVLGVEGELLASGRLDNLCSCWAAITALIEAAEHGQHGAATAIPAICLYDHEEIGSSSATGADGVLLRTVLERSVLARGGARDDLHRALAASVCASADMAHATHPNYVERHDPDHLVAINGGPVLKVNANQRYATNAETGALFAEACDRAGVPMQHFVSRNDMPCGSTIGPITAARLGVATVDVGVAQLSMHSARELCGTADPPMFVAALTELLQR
ncbi:MAG: M18 family aminopeptidase [Actinomycetota bacterium]|nr:M18 family aminopeptidase [Actinomycetota bacterium]